MYFGETMGKWSQLTMKEHQEADTVAEESFRNVKTVAALGAEKKLLTKYHTIVRNCGDLATKLQRKAGCALGGMAGSNELANALMYVFTVIIVYYQRKGYPTDLIINGCMNTPNTVDVCFANSTFVNEACAQICGVVDSCWFDKTSSCLMGSKVAIMIYAVLNSFMGIGSSFTSLQVLAKSKMSAAYFLEVIDHEDTMKNDGKVVPSDNRGDIVFSDIGFKYAIRDTQVLNHLNLTIHEDEMLGIVGESGCGKSTVLKLLMQLYAPNEGTITWNGRNVNDLSTTWIRDNISYVAQEPVLFSGTIRENLMYGRIGCTESEMMEAAKLVEADSFIRSFPKGYDTFVGELGTSLSGGQKQRIAIARALLRHPRVLVLDEATSALDSQSEAIVQRAIESIRQENKKNGGSLSIVVVAHRLSTIHSCDRIVVLDEGHVVEEGTHSELMGKKGVYAALYENQETVGSVEVSPTEETTVEAKSVASSRALNSTAEETETKEDENEDDELPDEIDPSQMIRVPLMRMLRFAGPHEYLFWLGLIGTVFRAFYPPVYSYVTATIQGLLYDPDLITFLHEGWKLNIPVVIAAALTFIGTYENWWFHGVVGEDIIVSVRTQCFQKLLNSPIAFFDEPKHLPSILTSRLSIDGRRIRDVIDRLSPVLENSLLVIMCLFLCFGPAGNWKLGLLAVILSPFLVSVEYLQNMIVFRVTEKIDNDLTLRSGELTDYLLNIHTIHSYNLEDTIQKHMCHTLQPIDKLTNKRTSRSALGQGLTVAFPSFYMLATMALGAVLAERGETQFTKIFTVVMGVFMCAQFVGINIAYTASFKLAQRSANNILALLDNRNENEEARTIKKEGHNGDITFTNVSFTYPTRPDVPILKDVSFTIPVGKSVAFVGPSGCGKSTTISLIQRFYRPDTGSISLGGDLIESLSLDWYRGLLGAVNQEPVMFAGTIRYNLQLGVEKTLTDAELEEVCRQALCLDFINEMPDRFDTDLGAVGKAVSGGQKQRLALARAILRNPSILLLDEATSALDSENQDKFLTALKAWRETHPCTVVTVAHRLSTIVDSDIIFVVHDGIIAAQGTHEELLKNCDFYANLVRGQMETSPMA
ncbi:hypothetical protein WA538_004324 [Blastocystis sp. DL]